MTLKQKEDTTVEEDFEAFYKENHKKQVKRMSRNFGNEFAVAEDIVQEAYTRAWKYLPSFDASRANMNTWFNSILFNTFRSHKRGEQEGVEASLLMDTAYTIPKSILSENINSYPSKDKIKRILHLYYVLGYNSRQISEIEDQVTQTNVTTILARFKAWMKQRHSMEL